MATSKNTSIKITTILLIVVLIGALAYYFKDEIKKIFHKEDAPKVDAPFENPKETTTQSTPKQPKALPLSTDLDMNLVLKKGSKGKEVIVLQTLLNKRLKEAGLNYMTLVVDGNFGAKTESALNQIFKVKSSNIGMLPVGEIGIK